MRSTGFPEWLAGWLASHPLKFDGGLLVLGIDYNLIRPALETDQIPIQEAPTTIMRWSDLKAVWGFLPTQYTCSTNGVNMDLGIIKQLQIIYC